MKLNKMYINNLILFILPVIALLGMVQMKSSHYAVEAVSPDIVISEIQIAGMSANDEFVELYNPTQNTIDLSGWRLSRRSSSISGSITNLVSSITGTIQPYGFFLIANPSFTGSITPDLYYSATTSGIATNNTVLLYRDNGQTLVDKVGMGSAEDVESLATLLPENLNSIERKAHQNATYESMTNGIDMSTGNGFDSDNNLQDFIVRIHPEPQNSQSEIEQHLPIVTPTEQPSPTETMHPTIVPTEPPTPTETPVPTVIIIPTHTPMPIPTDTPVPTLPISPTQSPTPTDTISPTSLPTHTPTIIPTLSPTSVPYPSLSPSPKPRPTPTIVLHCTWKQKTIETYWFTYTFKFPQCSLMRVEKG